MCVLRITPSNKTGTLHVLCCAQKVRKIWLAVHMYLVVLQVVLAHTHSTMTPLQPFKGFTMHMYGAIGIKKH